MKNRSRINILSSILESAIGGETRIKIMYKSYLSYAQLREYLSILLKSSLLEYEEGREIYRTTKKGLRYMATCEKIDKMVAA